MGVSLLRRRRFPLRREARAVPLRSASGSSLRKVTPDKVLDEVAPYGGKVLRTSLTKDQESQLQEVLDNRGVTA
ncbi:MAG: DUF1269 domain-containing protein [Cyanobacteria bacterium CRU_2_1]|nr:DUF1269 domain-containing protein [Cyanobacteria bacterium CRU_2_1]